MTLKEFRSVNKGLGQFQILFDDKIWQETLEESLQTILKVVKVDGFRKGKAPLDQAMRQISSQDRIREASRLAIRKAYNYLQKQTTKLKPFSNLTPKIIEASFAKCLIAFVFELPFQAEVKSYQGFNLKNDEIKITNNDVAAELKLLQKQFALTKEVDVAALDDIVTINYIGYLEKVPFVGGSSQGYRLELGSHQFIDNFEEQLIGATPNSKRTVQVTFPKDYAKPNLRNKLVSFEVEIVKIERRTLPPIDLELVKDVNLPNIKTVAALKKYIKSELLAKRQTDFRKEFCEQLTLKIAADSDLVFPNQILKQQMEQLKQEFESKILQTHNLNLKNFIQVSGMNEREIEDNLYSDAYADVCWRFIKNTAIQKEKITVTKEEIANRYAKLAESLKMTVAEIKKDMVTPDQVKNLLLDEKISD